MNKNGNTKKNSLLSKLTQFFLDVAMVEKNDITGSGTAYVIFTLADGKEIMVDADGFVTLGGEQLPAGEHALSDGNVLVVDDQGQFIETKDSAVKTQNPDQVTAPQSLNSQEEEESVKVSDDESVDALKAKIAELEARLSELSDLAREANAEVQKLRKVTPSVLPATALSATGRCVNRHEQMAQALSQAIKKRRFK